jgi:biofilm PGA synthesis N-glycosyltransferase PgaC
VDSIFLYILAIANLVYVVHIGLYTVGANSYDILRFKREHALKSKPIRKLKKQPVPKLISIVIPAHNEAGVIKRTLDSVLASSYQNIEVLIVNDGSNDNTAKIVRDYIKRIKRTKSTRVWSYFDASGYASNRKLRYIRIFRQKTRIRLINQRNQGKAVAMNNAIQNYIKGELVMCLDADSIVHPEAVGRAVGYFKDKTTIGVAANVRVIESKTILGRVQRFEHMIGYRSKKFYSLTNSEFIIGGVASTYRKNVIKKVKFYDNDTLTEDIGLSLKIIAQSGNLKRRIVYASDVVAFTEGVQTFGDLLKQRYRWKMGSLQNLYKYKHLIGKLDTKRYSRMLTLYRLPMAIFSEVLLLIEPILVGYIVYLSIEYRTFGIAIGAYLTITFYTLTVLWPDEHLTLLSKAKLSITSLWIYIFFYIMDIVQLYAVIKSLHLYENIINREKLISTWTSPKRSTIKALALNR